MCVCVCARACVCVCVVCRTAQTHGSCYFCQRQTRNRKEETERIKDVNHRIGQRKDTTEVQIGDMPKTKGANDLSGGQKERVGGWVSNEFA